MDALFRTGRGTVGEVRASIPDAPSYSAIRALLRILEEKGQARHVREGAKYVYLPMQARKTARRSALRRLVDVFFEGSVTRAAAALLDESAKRLTAAELDELDALIAKARKEGK